MNERAEIPLLVDRHDYVLVVTLNRPERRNALDESLLSALRGLWGDPEALRGTRCIVLTGADPGFCSGADMSLLSRDRSDAPRTAREELEFLPGRRVECPVVVAVNGVCAGGGLHFVADADIVVASEQAIFLDPHVSVGQVSALEPLTLWPRVQAAAIARMALIGSSERLTAAEALRVGLVSEVVPATALHERALELAAAVSANSPAAVAATRKVLRTFEEGLLEDALEDGWAAIREHWAHPDAREGPQAFTDKRQPRWARE
jgi:enoyl-CoA hydratase/carnithine racemase